MTTPKIEESLEKIAHELKRKNDMLEISTLLDAAEKIRAAARSTADNEFYDKCYASARALVNVAMEKLGLNDSNGDK